MPHMRVEERWRWWTDTLGSPRYIMAPMVLQSALAFRLLARRHGCDLCYSPMLPSAAFLASDATTEPENPETGGPATRNAWFTTNSEDRPLLVQLGGSDFEELRAAALLVQGSCDGIDLNFGCPQRCAEQGRYGAFLLTEPVLVRRLVTRLVAEVAVPVTAKMRILPDVEATVEFAKMLEEAGVAAVAVHGRRREQRHHEGAADFDQIAAVKAALRIPVIANGNVRTRADAERALAATGADAVMSATALLANPRLFASPEPHGDGVRRWRDGRPTPLCRLEIALEYCAVAERFPDGTLPRMISDHLLALLRPELERPEAGTGVLRLLKAWRSMRAPHQYAALVRHLAARLNLGAALGRGAARPHELLLGPTLPLATIALGAAASAPLSEAAEADVLRDLEGDELRAVNARLRHDVRRYHAWATGGKEPPEPPPPPTPTRRPDPPPETRRRPRTSPPASPLVDASDIRAAALRRRRRRSPLAWTLLGRLWHVLAAAAFLACLALHVAGASAEPFGEPSHRTGFHSEDFDAVLNRVESHGGAAAAAAAARRGSPLEALVAQALRSSDRAATTDYARELRTLAESDDGARDVLAMLVGAGESSAAPRRFRAETMGAALPLVRDEL